jgi:tetratricopeptide (TPR) repeat protein
VFASRWLFLGFDFGEASYAAQAILSWQTTVVGDPLYQPFKKNLQEHHLAFLAQTNRLAAWSTERLINLNRQQGLGLAELAAVLESTPLTKESAVLSEKLADLYAAQGKPASTILMYERALKLDSTPQQRIRLRLELGTRLIAAGRKEDAQKNYEQLLTEMPDYADAAAIRQKIAALIPKG